MIKRFAHILLTIVLSVYSVAVLFNYFIPPNAGMAALFFMSLYLKIGFPFFLFLYYFIIHFIIKKTNLLSLAPWIPLAVFLFSIINIAYFVYSIMPPLVDPMFKAKIVTEKSILKLGDTVAYSIEPIDPSSWYTEKLKEITVTLQKPDKTVTDHTFYFLTNGTNCFTVLFSSFCNPQKVSNEFFVHLGQEGIYQLSANSKNVEGVSFQPAFSEVPSFIEEDKKMIIRDIPGYTIDGFGNTPYYSYNSDSDPGWAVDYYKIDDRKFGNTYVVIKTATKIPPNLYFLSVSEKNVYDGYGSAIWLTKENKLITIYKAGSICPNSCTTDVINSYFENSPIFKTYINKYPPISN